MGDVHMQAWLARSMGSVQSSGTVKHTGGLEMLASDLDY